MSIVEFTYSSLDWREAGESILCQISRVRHLFSKSVLTTIQLNCLVFCLVFFLLDSLVRNVYAQHKQIATYKKLRRPCVD